MKEWLIDLNESLPGILIIDLVYLVLGEIIIFLCVPNPIFCAIGFLVGVAYAVFCVFHMSFQIRKVVYGGDSRAFPVGSALRMALMMAVFVTLHYFNIGHAVAAIIGMFAMKVSAYIEPAARKITSKILKKGG